MHENMQARTMRRPVTLPRELAFVSYPPGKQPVFGMFQIVAIFALIVAVTPAAADASAAWEALRKGGHVALMRHADAPGGAGDPPGFKLDDCSTQRNLSERGRADAVAMGAQIRANGISFSRESSARPGAAALKRQN